MNIDSMRELFGQEDTYFNVVFSDRELSIPSGKLYSILSRQEIEKSSEIFVNMMMNMIYTLLIVSAVIFLCGNVFDDESDDRSFCVRHLACQNIWLSHERNSQTVS